MSNNNIKRIIEATSEIYIGFQDCTDNELYIINNCRDSATVVNKINEIRNSDDYNADGFWWEYLSLQEVKITRLIDANISSLTISESVNKPSTASITGNFKEEEEEGGNTFFNRLIDIAKKKLIRIIIYVKIYKNDTSLTTQQIKIISAYDFIFKDIAIKKGLKGSVGFTINCVHWFDQFKSIPVQHVASLNNGELMGFYNNAELEVWTNDKKKTFSPFTAGYLYKDYKGAIESCVEDLLTPGIKLSGLVNIFERTSEYIKGISVDISEPDYNRYSTNVKKLGKQFLKSTQPLIISRLDRLFKNLKNQLKYVESQGIAHKEYMVATDVNISKQLTKLIVERLARQANWYDFIMYILGFFGLNLKFTTSEFPTVETNEPFVTAFGAKTVDDSILSSSINIPTQKEFTRLIFVPPVSSSLTLLHQGQQALYNSIIVPEIKDDNDADLEEQVCGLRPVIIQAGEWIGHLILYYLKKWNEHKELKMNKEDASVNYEANLKQYSELLASLEAQIVALDGLSLFSPSESETATAEELIKKAADDGNLAAQISVFLSTNWMLAEGDDFSVISPLEDKSLHEQLTQAVQTAKNLKNRHKELQIKLADLEKKRAILSNSALTLKSDQYVKKLTGFLYNINKYASNTAQIVTPIVDHKIAGSLGVAILFGGYQGFVNDTIHTIAATGELSTTLNIAYVAKVGELSKSQYLNPLYDKSEITPGDTTSGALPIPE